MGIRERKYSLWGTATDVALETASLIPCPWRGARTKLNNNLSPWVTLYTHISKGQEMSRKNGKVLKHTRTEYSTSHAWSRGKDPSFLQPHNRKPLCTQREERWMLMMITYSGVFSLHLAMAWRMSRRIWRPEKRGIMIEGKEIAQQTTPTTQRHTMLSQVWEGDQMVEKNVTRVSNCCLSVQHYSFLSDQFIIEGESDTLWCVVRWSHFAPET